MTRQLRFLAPRYDSFLKIIRSLRDQNVRSIRLIGNNELAAKIVVAAKQQGIALTCVAARKKEDVNKAQAIVFTEMSGELLSSQLLTCVDFDGEVVAPITDWHFSRKPLFLIAVPKAGTHLMYEMVEALGYRAGVEPPEFPLGQTWYCLEYSNSHTLARDFFVDTVRRKPFGNRLHPFMHTPTLFIFRHPLDILISEANYFHRDGSNTYSPLLSQYDFEERLERLTNDKWLIGSLRDRVGAFLPWLEFPNVIPFSFEELVGPTGGGNEEDQIELIWSLQLKLQAPGRPRAIASQTFNTSSPTFRSGQIGQYVNYLSAEAIRDFSTQNADLLGQFGYPLDGSFDLSTRRKNQRRKAVTYSKSNYERMPITIEVDFLGCNLVTYNNTAYAVPRAAGSIALEKLSPDVLAVLPAADSIESLKALLTIGYSGLLERKQSLQQLSAVLAEGKSVDNIHQYWNKISVFETYKGYNFVAHAGRYLALKQSSGEIDLIGNSLNDLVAQYGTDAVLIATSVSDLRDEIDGTKSAVFETYKGYNFVAHAGRYLALKQSSGEIDLIGNSLNDLVAQYGTDAVLIATSVSDLRDEIDGVATSQRLQQETATKNEQSLVRIEATLEHLAQRIEELQASDRSLQELQETATKNEQSLVRIEATQEHLAQRIEELQASDRSLQELQQETATKNEQSLVRIEATQEHLAKSIVELEENVQRIQLNWAIRLSRKYRKIFRGSKD